ncbi:MAG: SUF system NifU family Fe-S cluster assembly protein [Verrucomicrobiaceae bacterium]|jgi:nitrogen fixation NifU-like protein|nr:SUF system NifU family Fe-S cluster assembly protein [Verrucomicrobiales bacterium]MDB4467699.1 SUF system NifU family Fe-S cluster assembly protein [Verrucomicrobiales bacterium]MDF1788778.1 SUF system NifU family Fe-S cluster assembly protein [Verrucomicrobiales bacterium]NCF93320.1 SUF system NifU family Fe-S cluster assembly protein [Verrucomicrobiaceae bacterium]
MDDLNDLYQEIILSHNRRPRNEGVLEPCDCQAEGFNPLCGDRITVYVCKDSEGSLEKVQFLGEGCAISRASASIMTLQLAGRSVDEAHAKIADIAQLLTQDEEPEADLEVLGDLTALLGVRRFPARIKCATLAWHAVGSALRGEAKHEER